MQVSLIMENNLVQNSQLKPISVNGELNHGSGSSCVCCTPYGTSQKCRIFRDLFLTVLNIPCFLYEGIHFAILMAIAVARRQKIDFRGGVYGALASKSEWFESRVQYDDVLWPMVDVDCEESKILYQAKVRQVLSEIQSQDSCQSSQGKRKLKLEVDLLCGASFPSRYDVILTTCKELPLHTRQGIASMLLTRAIMNDNEHFVKSAITICGSDCVSVFQEGPFRGLTALHCAVLNEKSKIVQTVLELLSPAERYELVHTAAADDASLPECLDSSKIVLHMAVRMGQLETTRILVSQGAELTQVDKQGHNVFHLCGFLSLEDGNQAVRMFAVLISLVPTWIENTHQFSYLRKMPRCQALIVAKVILLKAATNSKSSQTPLKLATEMGYRPLVEAILNVEGVYCFPGLNTREALYDVTEICPVGNLLADEQAELESLSVLELLTTDSNDRSLDCLDIPVLAKALDTKLHIHTPHILLFSAVHLLLMIVFTITIYYSMDMEDTPNNCTVNGATPGDVSAWRHLSPTATVSVTNNCTLEGTSPWDRLSPTEYAVGAISVFYLHYSIGCFVAIGRFARLRRLTPRGVYKLLNILQVSTLFSFPVSIITYYVLKVLQSSTQVYVLSVAFLLGWFHVLMYTRAFRATAFFSIMIHRVLIGDVLRFLMVITLMVIAFATSTGVILHAMDGHIHSNTSSMEWIVLDYFKLATGVTDFARLSNVEEQTPLEIFKIVIYICFIVLANVLMFNLLIAAMSDRYSQISHLSRLLCLKVQAADMLVLERMLPPCLRNKALNLYTRETWKLRMPDGSHMRRDVHLLKVSLKGSTPP